FPLGETACPSVVVTICTSNQFTEKNPDFTAFLGNYHTSSALTSEALAHMQDTGANYTDTAKWFLTEHPELLTEWLPPEDVAKMDAMLSGKDLAAGKNWFTDFPFALNINLEAIDRVVRDFSVRTSSFFGAIKGGLTALISGIQSVLNFIPWWLLLALVFLAGWKICGRIKTGLLYTVMLFVVGLFGLWELMNETLSIVLASVVISLLLGLPIGILISSSRRANS
ncbi:MAG: ABC transporter permease, partial [Pygmaiobacter sp.]